MLAGLVRDYGDIDAEVTACRTDAVLFDFSFVSRGTVRGPSALAAVQTLTPRPLAALRPGRILYAVRLDESGFARADLTIWQTAPETFEVFSGRREDIAALSGGRDLSDETCILAVQGPRSLGALAPHADAASLAALGYFDHAAIRVAGVECRVGRLGYTGERGFEIVAPASAKEHLSTTLARGMRRGGFAAADVLRIEAGFVLFVNELRPRVTAAEAGLSRFCPAGQGAPRVELVGFTAQCDARPVLFEPPQNMAFPPAAGEIAVTSAAWSARLDRVIGLGYVGAGRREAAFTDPTGGATAIRRAQVPFIDPEKRRVRGGWAASLLPVYG